MPPTKTTSIDLIDAWQIAPGGKITVGAAKSISDSYDSILYIEVAGIEAEAYTGTEVIIEISNGDDNWQKLATFKGTAESVSANDLNGIANYGTPTVTLTDAMTGGFYIKGNKWFIKDGTIANSESVRTRSNATHVVTICELLNNSHADETPVYNSCDEWAQPLPRANAQVRTLINNIDAFDVAFTTRISKVTGK